MTTKERILRELERIDDDDLDELYNLIEQFAASREPSRSPGLLAKLKQVSIDAPPDFAANLDLYLSGEKRAGSDLR